MPAKDFLTIEQKEKLQRLLKESERLCSERKSFRVLQQINDPKSENYAIVKQTSSVQSVPCCQNLPSN